VILNRSHDDGVETHRDPAITAETHTASERVPGFVGHSSAEAHISLLETSDATFTIGEDAVKDTSPSRH